MVWIIFYIILHVLLSYVYNYMLIDYILLTKKRRFFDRYNCSYDYKSILFLNMIPIIGLAACLTNIYMIYVSIRKILEDN